MKFGASLPINGESATGMPPAAAGINSPTETMAIRFSFSCWRYSQLAHPAQAKTESRKSTVKRTIALRRMGKDLTLFIVRKELHREHQPHGLKKPAKRVPRTLHFAD